MSPRRWPWSCGLAGLVAIGLGVGCDPWSILPTRQDPAYCDPATPCPDPVHRRCDPVEHRCVDVVSTGDLGPVADLAVIECHAAPDCTDPARPACESGRCRSCVAGSAADDAQCRDHSPGLPRCGKAGRCVACSVNGDCPGATPVCDAEACRTCKSGSECASAICRDDGSCESPANVAWVDSGGQRPADCLASGTHDGKSRATAFCDIDAATHAPQRRPALVVIGSGYGAFTVDSGTLLIVGPGATLLRGQFHVTSAGGPAVRVAGGGTDLTLRDLYAVGGRGSAGVECQGQAGTAKLSLQGGVYRGGLRGAGVLVGIGCQASATGTTVLNSVAGVHVRGGQLDSSRLDVDTNSVGVLVEDLFSVDDNTNHPGQVTLDRADIHGNTTGVLCNGTGYCQITNSLLRENGDPNTVDAGGARVAGSLTLVFDFNTVVNNVNANGVAAVFCYPGQYGHRIQNSILFGNTRAPGGYQTNLDCHPHQDVVTGNGDALGKSNSDPVFVNPAAHDYHLVVNDPSNVDCCVDQALDLSNGAYTHHDKDGKARPAGRASDIGAYETQ